MPSTDVMSTRFHWPVALMTRERLRAATIQEIKATARRLLVTQGPHSVTLRAIAREMGMTAPGLYRYFPSHEDLWQDLCHDTYAAGQGVRHDDMNVLAMGARVIGIETAVSCAESFLAARFSGAERHVRRVRKIQAIEGEAASLADISRQKTGR